MKLASACAAFLLVILSTASSQAVESDLSSRPWTVAGTELEDRGQRAYGALTTATVQLSTQTNTVLCSLTEITVLAGAIRIKCHNYPPSTMAVHNEHPFYTLALKGQRGMRVNAIMDILMYAREHTENIMIMKPFSSNEPPCPAVSAAMFEPRKGTMDIPRTSISAIITRRPPCTIMRMASTLIWATELLST